MCLLSSRCLGDARRSVTSEVALPFLVLKSLDRLCADERLLFTRSRLLQSVMKNTLRIGTSRCETRDVDTYTTRPMYVCIRVIRARSRIKTPYLWPVGGGSDSDSNTSKKCHDTAQRPGSSAWHKDRKSGTHVWKANIPVCLTVP